ncbi:protein PRY1-like isoform X2 [Haliotis rubra]|uniref:protein PRY1-like isoform X2 n=1 Tax=Haliotis rubra TaxID=36100 RepID=UPI001EE55481|nr:protein PRY1-like isoform X2 [Haliotis rubra]
MSVHFGHLLTRKPQAPSSKQQAPITDQMTMFTSISWAWRSTPLTEGGDPDRDDSAATDTTSGHNSSQPLRGKIVQGKEACDMWYSEISKYDYNKAGYSNGTGHFTQMVWKSSKGTGCRYR